MLRNSVFRLGGAANVARSNVLKNKMMLTQMRDFHASGGLNKKDEEPLGPSLIEKYQLDEPSRYIPLTAGTLGFSTMTGLYHIDAESQLLVLWVLFCGTLYTRAGPLIADYFDEVIGEIETTTQDLQKAELDAVKEALAAHKRQTAIYDDITEIFADQSQVMESIVASANGKLAHDMRDAYAKKLNTMVALEQKHYEEFRVKLVESATKSVQGTYTSASGEGLKADALKGALSALSNPQDAKKDSTVSDLYTKYFADFNARLESERYNVFELSAEEVQEVQEAAEAIARRENLDPSIVKVEKTGTLADI